MNVFSYWTWYLSIVMLVYWRVFGMVHRSRRVFDWSWVFRLDKYSPPHPRMEKEPSSLFTFKYETNTNLCFTLYHCISRVRPSTSFFVFPCMVYIHSCGGRARAPRPKTTTRGGGGRIGVESLRMVKFRWNHRIEKSLVLCWFKAFLSSCETPCF